MFFKALDYPTVIIDSEFESPRLRGTIIRSLAEELENSNQRVMANLTLDDARVAARTGDLAAALAEAERANSARVRFVAAASHDLDRTVATLAGGVAGHVYRISNRVTMSDGQVDERSMTLRVEER